MGSFAMTVVYERETIKAVIPPDVQVSWMSFTIEQGLEWMLGKGVHRMKFERLRLPDGKVELLIEADGVKSQSLKFASVTKLKILADEAAIPEELEERWGVGLASEAGTVLTSEGVRTELSIADLTYGLSDMIVAFFLRGAQKARYQISRKDAQIWVDLGMTGEEVVKFVKVERDYGPETTVGDLPWRS
jgi:hypothetical protein